MKAPFPAGHVAQEEDPEPLAKLPCGQLVHDTLPTEGANRPGLQLLHKLAAAPLVVPAGHRMQEAALAGLYFPAEQAVQELLALPE